MTERTVYRGDGYQHARQVFACTLVNEALDGPFDMTGCTILTSFKPSPIAHETDPEDASAALNCSIVFGGDGSVVSSDGLRLPDGKEAEDGELWLTADRADTLALPLNTPLRTDMKVVYAVGEPVTIPSVWTLRAVDPITNRIEP